MLERPFTEAMFRFRGLQAQGRRKREIPKPYYGFFPMEEEEKKKKPVVSNRAPLTNRDPITNKAPITTRAPLVKKKPLVPILNLKAKINPEPYQTL